MSRRVRALWLPVPWLATLPFIAAAAACWSRRQGGTPREAALAALFPAIAALGLAIIATPLDILVDVLTWELARLAIACDTPAAAADILKSLGKHMGEIVARRDAQAEAKAAKEKGALPH